MKKCVALLWAVAVAFSLTAAAADNLRLNQHLDYSSDSHDGPLITGDHLSEGVIVGKPAYIIIYGEGCFNSKRQARRTVELYAKYRDKVQFVVVDLDQKLTGPQEELVTRFYRGYIPHVVVLDRDGRPLYNSSGEVEETKITKILDGILR
jgi:hypothetical protein